MMMCVPKMSSRQSATPKTACAYQKFHPAVLFLYAQSGVQLQVTHSPKASEMVRRGVTQKNPQKSFAPEGQISALARTI
jgi:hypothetical protein